MFLLYAILILIPLILFYIHQKILDGNLKVGVLGPQGLALIGSVLEMSPYVKTQKMFQKFLEYHELYGDTYQVRLGPTKLIVSRDPKVTEAIVNNPKFGKSKEYGLLKQWLGESILIANGEKWHKMRKLTTPGFHFQILERFIPIFEEHTDTFIAIVKKERNIGNGAIDMFPKMHSLTLDIISETSMGVQLKAQSDPHHPFILANEKVVQIFDKRMFNGFLAIEWIYRLTSLAKVQDDNVAIINNFVQKVIEERHEKLTKDAKSAEESETKKRPALLDILLQARVDGEPLSNEQIQDEVKIFMFAGHETTANTLAFCFFMIAKHPEVQNRLWQEIKTLGFHNKSDCFTIRDLNSLSYMDNVIKEVMRLFPAAAMIFKESKEDIQIGDVTIPKGITVATNIYGAHRVEKYFKNVSKFNPDRFDKELTAEDRNPYAFQPFSSGLRNCIGQKFALLEMKTILTKVLSSFEVELIDKNFEVDLIQMGTLRSKNGVPLILKDRK